MRSLILIVLLCTSSVVLATPPKLLLCKDDTTILYHHTESGEGKFDTIALNDDWTYPSATTLFDFTNNLIEYKLYIDSEDKPKRTARIESIGNLTYLLYYEVVPRALRSGVRAIMVFSSDYTSVTTTIIDGPGVASAVVSFNICKIIR